MPKVVGAPSQRSQPSRKGKKAWRKNVDIDIIEDGLETIRDQERLVGEAVHKLPDEGLFKIDVEGDKNLQRAVPKFDMSQLRSAKLIAQRSAVPAIFSKPNGVKSQKTKLTQEEKARLLRIGKRKVKGPFNSYVDPTQLGAGSALLETTEAVKQSGTYDIWSDPSEPFAEYLKGTRNYDSPEDYLLPIVVKPSIKPPKTMHINSLIHVPAVPDPHAGTSYQPLHSAREQLISSAEEFERKKEAEKSKYQSIKEKMLAAVPDEGMTLDDLESPAEGEQAQNPEDVAPASKLPPRKTKKQRRKAARLLAERRALQEERRKRRLYAAIPSAKSVRTGINKSLRSRREALDTRRAMRIYRLRRLGLAGQKLGKFRVKENPIDVQLNEELSENLRRLKPEGNLLRDRFISFQHRAMLEPRVPVLPKKRRTKIKEYEKHAWKKFDRDQ